MCGHPRRAAKAYECPQGRDQPMEWWLSSNQRAAEAGGSELEGAVLDERKDAKKAPLAYGEATKQAGQRKAQRAPILMKLMAVLLWVARGRYHSLSFCLLHGLVRMHLAVGHLLSVAVNLLKEVLINLLLTSSILSPDSLASCSAGVYLGVKILM